MLAFRPATIMPPLRNAIIPHCSAGSCLLCLCLAHLVQDGEHEFVFFVGIACFSAAEASYIAVFARTCQRYFVSMNASKGFFASHDGSPCVPPLSAGRRCVQHILLHNVMRHLLVHTFARILSEADAHTACTQRRIIMVD